MNHASRSATSIAALVLMLALAGCTAPASPAATGSATPSAPPAEAPESEPKMMTTEEAGERYLSIVCEVNGSVDATSAAFYAAQPEYLDGGTPDPAPVSAAASRTLELMQLGIEQFDHERFPWPESVVDQIDNFRSGYIARFSFYQAAANAVTFEEVTEIPRPATTAEQDNAAQEIRYELDLPVDTAASCVGYENALTELAE